MSQLSEAVNVLTEDHKVKVSGPNEKLRLVDEYSLLRQLTEAKTMKLNGGGGGQTGSKLPFGAGPSDIEEGIIRTIHYTVGVHNRDAAARLPLPAKVKFWAEHVDEQFALEWVQTWSDQIRDLFRTKFHLDAACPECGVATVTKEEDGTVTPKDALMVTVETQTAGCANCGNIWVGEDELKYLSSKLT